MLQPHSSVLQRPGLAQQALGDREKEQCGGVLSSGRQSGGRESRISLKTDRCRVKSSCVCQTPVKQEGEKTAILTLPGGWE